MPYRRLLVARSLLALGAACAAGPALAETPGRFAPEHVARLRSVTSATVSPDGTRIAYTVAVPRRPMAEDDGPAWVELHVVTPDKVSRPYVTGEVNVSEVVWTADSRGIAFLSKRGKDEFKSVYLIPAEGGEARRVATHRADITAFSLASDGKRLAFLATEPDPKARQELKKKGFSQILFEEDYHPVKVWIAALGEDTAEPRRLDLPGSASELRWSPVGTRIALALAPSPSVDDGFTRRKVHIADADSGKVVARFDNPGKLGKIAWSLDGSRIAYIAAADIHDPAPGRAVVASASGGEPRDVLPDFEGHVADIAWIGPTNLGIVADQGTATSIGSINVEAKTCAFLPIGDLIATTGSSSRDHKVAAMVAQSPTHPPEVFLFAGDEGLKRLTDSNPWLSGMAFARQEVVRYKARDGLDLEGILIRPLGVPEATRVPLVLDVHGGPESHVRNGWMTGYSTPGQVLAAKGIAVFAPNYRGSTGRGVAFSKQGQGDPAGKEFDDLVDAVDHLVSTGLVDRAKVGVTGGSYGGYATGWCSTRYSDRFAAGVMFVGISDKTSKTGTTDIPEEEFLVHALRRPWDDWNLLLERSPIFHTDKARTPLLILHGKDDPRVFPGQSLELYRFLKIRGQAPVRLVLYPGEGHGNLRAASRLDYNLRMVQWFTHYLQGPGGPPSRLGHRLRDRETLSNRLESGQRSAGEEDAGRASETVVGLCEAETPIWPHRGQLQQIPLTADRSGIEPPSVA